MATSMASNLDRKHSISFFCLQLLHPEFRPQCARAGDTMRRETILTNIPT